MNLYSTTMKIRDTEYRIDVYPYSETDRELVWSAFRKGTYGWDKMRLFTRSQCRNFPKTLARRAVEFYNEIKTKEAQS